MPKTGLTPTIELWIANHKTTELPTGSSRVQQINHLVEKTGIDRAQAETLLQKSFEKDFEVTVGGSRVRGNVRPNSDLDIGYKKTKPGENLNTINNQVGKINKAVEKAGTTPIKHTKIFPGNETSNIPRIDSPEELTVQKSFFNGLGLVLNQAGWVKFSNRPVHILINQMVL